MEIREHMDHAYARRLAGQVARYLKDRYGARKVLVFGSLVTGFFNPDFSPISVGFVGASENLDADANADAVSDCRFHFGHRDLDGINRLHIVSLKEVSPAMREYHGVTCSHPHNLPYNNECAVWWLRGTPEWRLAHTNLPDA